VKSLFNAESGCNFDLVAELPIEGQSWALGLVTGPSGSGKTSIGKKFFGGGVLYRADDSPANKPIIDAITPKGSFNDVTAALAGVGLGSVPSWLRPYRVLSNGEKFRADLARIICEAPTQVVIDEFSSVVDRQIAKFGALAFAKSWRRVHKRTGGQCVLLSCHYDIIDWITPDWAFDLFNGKFHGRWLQPRPSFSLKIWQTNWRYWPLFEPHHYLKLPNMIAAKCYVGIVGEEPVCHLGVSSCYTGFGVEARACRLVVMPEWQGAGVGLRFLNYIAQRYLDGRGHLLGRKLTTLFHTSHPGLAAALRHDPKWRQITAKLFGDNKLKSARSIAKANKKTSRKKRFGRSVGFGGHFRAVQGFRYYGRAGEKAHRQSVQGGA